MLLSPAFVCNPELPLCAYINRWFLTNGAAESLLQLYQSPYTVEALFGYHAQQTSGVVATREQHQGRIDLAGSECRWLPLCG